MSPRHGKVHRLVRLNEFRQDQASSVLRDAIAAQVHAERQHAQAVEDLDRVGAMRPQVLTGQGVDLMRYEILLAMERAAMARAAEAEGMRAEREQLTATAKEGLLNAATATRVARQRSRREQTALATIDEKRAFDRIADLRASAPEKTR